MDFRGPPTTADANRLILLPPFCAAGRAMCFHNRAIDQVQTVARFCRQRVENTLPDSSPRPAVEPIVRARVWAVAFGQIAPWDPRPQHVKYCIHDPPVVRARALPTLRHERLESIPFLIAEIESHDPPPPAVNHDAGCFSVNYAGTDPSAVSKPKTMAPMGSCFHPRNTQVNSKISWIARMGHGLRQQASLMTAVTAAADRRSLSSLLEKLLEEYCHERGFLEAGAVFRVSDEIFLAHL